MISDELKANHLLRYDKALREKKEKIEKSNVCFIF
jgi:hypothetical protein